MVLNCENLIAEWRASGVDGSAPLVVHSSLSRLGEVYGGAATVVQSLLAVTPTVVVPAFRNDTMGGQILLIGVDHTRNSFLHHCEALTPSPRLQKRVIGPGVAVDDVAGDYGRFFPVVGREFAVRRLTELLT